MNINSYPKITTIMRGYSYKEAMTVIEVLTAFDHRVGVEVTTNNPDYLKIIHDANEEYGDKVDIGVGTVLTAAQASAAVAVGAKFMLGPAVFNADIFNIARKAKVITVPAAMTPSEVVEMLNAGADIVKLFPASTLGPSFFKAIQGPLGRRRLMAVGGVNVKNARNFFENGASYLGVGSSMFNHLDVKTGNVNGLHESVRAFLATIPK
ncbi:bifunctional 4-hydroxy-2-oxoglutarate aldolase/2-dehydro-3-deoxy-phosphogluconate aldolase [Lacticaseibacillus rhamnosus]|uniref:bifunctional 4-hydroxy-2-oxoglutarate aldolase/2-dehydro-3-deoxy-phosphogluconate aldolase n=1 Tax=Lacticaseibacillus rhamnosus TaxID=47715 RepID=UPI0008A55EA0|nr:bifunctional 4-hydroxy-2-oxoglutarate aldolase/2-dehydro-3-deoxy-phosphogluconate aldolase [Lacticaseibacillus rhamnosus]OFN10339.1 2-dehydro-3-deoxyphosphogluconate aldolase [Lactobacillus sp. HMSC072E07]MDE3295502.1 bifunctional 4-hydroxy-2-oxoglutarate aldolase/2-dehydro-3-deoxy-phosphogluconate aldolase [Lacticaseibacillus rhamnosus]MDK7182397.1 bifunctional 4-hydroxy-2-oxoglutarate aldolase/2-dehydro-3-deoxy-phosphogluconate aldolase [Lacticaseibacillus rhamnosus]MDK7240412.1 bifunction